MTGFKTKFQIYTYIYIFNKNFYTTATITVHIVVKIKQKRIRDIPGRQFKLKQQLEKQPNVKKYRVK